MENAIETYEVEGLTVKIFQDDDPTNPRKDCDQAGTMVCWHSRYTLGDTHDFRDPDAFMEWWKENGKGGVLLPLFLYDHSGISMSTGRAYPFNCPWDSGQVGYIYVTRETIIKEWGKNGKAKAEKSLQGEVKEYDQYLTGDVYGYVVETPNGEHLDSCWGFYGLDYIKEEAESIAKHYAEGIRQAEEVEKTGFAL